MALAEEREKETEEGAEEETPQTPPADDDEGAEEYDYSAALPEQLRGQPPEKVKAYLEGLSAVLTSQGEILKQYREREQVGRLGQPAHARAAEPEPDEDDDVDLDTLWQTNPTKAMRRMLREELGQDREVALTGAATAAYLEARDTFTDFRRLEPQVRELLEQQSYPATPQTLRAAYFMVKGYETEESTKQSRAKGAKSEKPKKSAEHEEGPYKFENETEEAIFKASGMTIDQYSKARKAVAESERVTVDVKTD